MLTKVRDDAGSEVMQRSVAKGYLTEGCTSVITIVWEDRTLDFEIVEVFIVSCLRKSIFNLLRFVCRRCGVHYSTRLKS